MILKFIRNPSISQLTQWISNTLTKPITVHKKNAKLQELWISEVILTCWNVETLLLLSISMFDWAIILNCFHSSVTSFPTNLEFLHIILNHAPVFPTRYYVTSKQFWFVTTASDHDRLEVCYTICQTNLYKMCINSETK